jgi:hypothetical protein
VVEIKLGLFVKLDCILPLLFVERQKINGELHCLEYFTPRYNLQEALE